MVELRFYCYICMIIMVSKDLYSDVIFMNGDGGI